MELCREIMGNSGDDDSIFEGSTGDNLIKVDGDLDIDFDAQPSDNTSDSEVNDEEGDTLLTLYQPSRTRECKMSKKSTLLRIWSSS